MRRQDALEIIERLLTWILVVLVSALFGDSLARYRLYIIIGISSGLVFGWLSKNCSATQKGVIITLCSIAASFVLAWVAHTLAGSFFNYLDVVLVVVIGAFFLEVILSFATQASSFLSYLQLVALFLFLGSMVFIREFSPPAILQIGGYCITWIVLLKIKLYRICERNYPAERRWWQVLLLPSLAAAIVMILSWVLFSLITMPQLKKGGLLPVEEERKGFGDNAFDELQNEMQNKMTKLILHLQNIDEQRQALAQLASLLKETPETIEVEEAASGLVSRLRTPGPGIEKNERESAISLMNRYLPKKADTMIMKLNEKIIQQARRQGRVTMKQIISAAFLLNRIRSATSYQQLVNAEKKLLEFIDRSAAKNSAKDALKMLVEHLREWKIYSLYRRALQSLPSKIAKSDPEVFKTELTHLFSAITGAASPDDLKKISESLDSLKNRFSSAKNVTKDIEEFMTLKLEMIFMRYKWLLEQRLTEAGVPSSALQEIEHTVQAMHQELTQDTAPAVSHERLRSETEQLQEKIAQAAESSFAAEELKKDAMLQGEAIKDTVALQLENKEEATTAPENAALPPPLPDTVIKLSIAALPQILLRLCLALAIVIPLVFLSLYVATMKKRRAMCALFQEPRSFIIALYTNLIHALAVFGMAHRESIPPLAYAGLIQRHFAESGNLFLRLTEKFAEAKYSRHALGFSDASAALAYYNNFLKMVCRKEHPAFLFFKYCMAIAHRTPLFIKR